MEQNSKHIELSVVIPTCNEEGNIVPMYEQLCAVMAEINIPHFEFIFVDDGSIDATSEILKSFCTKKNELHQFGSAHLFRFAIV